MEPDSSKADAVEKDIIPSYSSSILNESPRKCNLSFSFNFDFDDVNSDVSSDSETADLQIDVSEIDNCELPSKHKRDTVEETSSVINEMEEEIERQLDAKAAKTNLTATNVKNILKHVITNEHVMAMVQKRLHNTEDDILFEPKLTRAKAKELAAAKVNIPWPITPMKKSTSEVQVLIEEELPEDSSDEEYNPEHDKQSDDDREIENSTSSDAESQQVTSVNFCDSPSFEQSTSPSIQYDPEGIFKIPVIPHVPTEEESIGQRTRSKLCLSETSLEQIEQAFIPPDITTDMYDWDCEIDEDWDNFLKEFTRPLAQDPVMEDDTEADPEYNILEDEETDLLDKEELRMDKAVKVTRKELNNLIAELFEFTDTFSKQEQEISKKKRSSENTILTNENNSLSGSMGDLPVWTEPDVPQLLSQEQRHLLNIQLCQHTQLMAQHFVMTFMHPELNLYSKSCKENLKSLRYLSKGPNSAFDAPNLSDALTLLSDWENKFLDSKFCEDFKRTCTDESIMSRSNVSRKNKYVPKFHPEIKKLFLESKALICPQLLPDVPFRSETIKHRDKQYTKNEETLIALGLEQFLPFVASKPRKYKSKKCHLIDACKLIRQYLMPTRETTGLMCFIGKRRSAKDPNPIKHYFDKGCAPRTIHYIPLKYEHKAPKDQPLNFLSSTWQTYLKDTRQKIGSLKRKRILTSCNDLAKKAFTNWGNKNYIIVSNTHPLRNPTVNILPKILPVSASQKNLMKNALKNISSIHENLETTDCAGTSHTTHDFEHLKRTSSSESNDASCSTELIDDEKSPKEDVNVEESKQQSKDDTPTNTITTRNSKLSKKSSEIMHELPQLRKTTPRLAKTRSAQNMKLMAQVLGPKAFSPNCNALKSREKQVLNKNSEKSSTLPKVDNEDEIAELMLASTTIKKDSLSRKKAKEARELENIKRLLESENALNEEERGSKFAASYLQKLHLMLEPINPETFKTVIKLYLDYNEKLDSINSLEGESSLSNSSKVSQNEEAEETPKDKDTIALDLYRGVCEKLAGYPELCSDFLLFLKPHQAAMIDKSVEYMMLQKMNEFVNVAQIYFAKQPSRIAKMMQAITQLSSNPHITLETVLTTMSPILKGHPIVMDLFLQILPSAKPPESLFAPHMFENLTCPLGPHDKNKLYTEDATELYENVELPGLPTQEDPYGGENCKCDCHNGDDSTFKSTSEHCVSCGTRFLNGRIYLQTSEGLRPAKIIFPGADEEKLENIARVSLKMTDKFVLPIPSRQRRKSSKNDFNPDDADQKPCSSKSSPLKDSDEGEKAIIKSKKILKSSPKPGDQKKGLKRLRSIDDADVNNKKIPLKSCKSKREKKSQKLELKSSDGDLSADPSFAKTTEFVSVDSGNPSKETTLSIKSDVSSDVMDTDKVSLSDKLEDTMDTKLDNTNTKPWTRQEDTILLQTIKKEYSEKSLRSVSKVLGNRTVTEVKERFRTLFSLLEKMA